MLSTRIALGALVAFSAAAGHAENVDRFDAGPRPASTDSSAQPAAATPGAFYSNIAHAGGSASYFGGPTASTGGNLVTNMACDDLSFATHGASSIRLTGYSLSVISFASSAVTVRPIGVFFRDDGDGGLPGTYLIASSTGAITLQPDSTQIVRYSFDQGAFQLPVSAAHPTVWACLYFDNNYGATGATAAQMAALGFGFYGQPDIGISQPTYFRSSGPGDFANNPAGGLTHGGPADVLNLGWELYTDEDVSDRLFANGFDS